MTIMSKWMIAVLSTDYDLHEHRTVVIDLLKSKDIIPSAFEDPAFPVAVGVHSHDACLAALKRVDAAILIIDKRAGGIYVGATDNTSITEAEFIEIAKSGKPYFVFVSKTAWDERRFYHTQLKASGKTGGEFDTVYTCSHVDKVDVIHFIDNIQHAYETFGTSNWICQFNGMDELKTAIEGKLSGLSQYYCYKIAEEQAITIQKRKTSTSMMLSLGDVISKGYYVEPEYDVVSGNLSISSTLTDDVAASVINGYSTLIIGEAGYGKTTILAKSFLTHVDKISATDYDIPFYINLKSRGSSYHFDFEQYISECFVEYLEKPPFPFLNLESIKPFFYLDSFDEIAEKITTEELSNFSQSSVFSRPFLLTCRNQFALRYLTSSEFAGKIANIVDVQKWSPDKANGYIQNFCSINNKPELFDNIQGLLTTNTELCDILDTPLLITMLLWVIEQNGFTPPSTIKNRVQLFSECIKQLAGREIEGLQLIKMENVNLLLIWAYAAWEVYYAKIHKSELKYDELIKKLTSYFPDNGINEKWFAALFHSKNQKIVGTFHEQFLEFLSAYAIYYACLGERYPFPEFLGEVVRPEINRYFRQLWSDEQEESKRTILNNVKKLYTEKLVLHDNLSIMQRIHAIYHLSRMNLAGNTDFINDVLKVEQNTSVKISLFFGAIKLGLLDKEEELYNLLVSSDEYSDSNRGYHLAYYGDILSVDKLPFKDDPCVSWSATMNAFMRHFKSTEDGHYFLWRIDLLTMRQLMEARPNQAPLTDDVLSSIKALIDKTENKRYPDYQKSVENEFETLSSAVSARRVPST